MIPVQKFGELVRVERARKDWSQLRLAQEVDCSPGYIVKVEANKVPHMSLDKAVAIADVLGIALCTLQTWRIGSHVQGREAS